MMVGMDVGGLRFCRALLMTITLEALSGTAAAAAPAVQTLVTVG